MSAEYELFCGTHDGYWCFETFIGNRLYYYDWMKESWCVVVPAVYGQNPPVL